MQILRNIQQFWSHQIFSEWGYGRKQRNKNKYNFTLDSGNDGKFENFLA